MCTEVQEFLEARGVGYLEDGITGSSELTGIGATWVFCKSSTYS